MGAVWENPAAAAVPGKYRWCLNMAVQYKRILLKVSGEALSGEKGTGFDETTIASICAGIKAAYDLGAQIGIVVGGGNFWRGRSSGKMDRMDADKIGMLATVMNAIAVKDALRQQGVPAVVMTSSAMPQVPIPSAAIRQSLSWKQARSSCSAAAPATPSSLLIPHPPARLGNRCRRHVQGNYGGRRV